MRIFLRALFVGQVAAFMTTGDALGAALVAQLGVAGVVFTGSTQEAKIIQRALAAKDGPLGPDGPPTPM